MLKLVIFLIVVFIIGSLTFVNGNFYRKPFLLVLWGLVLSLFGGYCDYALKHIASHTAFASIFPNLELSAQLVGFTIAAAGGSLIASGIVIKAQQLSWKEKYQVDQNVELAQHCYRTICENREKLEQKKADLTDDEYSTSLRKIIRAEERARDKVEKAKQKARKLAN